jgi:hypothetical protein
MSGFSRPFAGQTTGANGDWHFGRPKWMRLALPPAAWQTLQRLEYLPYTGIGINAVGCAWRAIYLG